MGLNYENLDDRVRKLMLKEIDIDAAKHNLTFSARLNAQGRRLYEGLLRQAVTSHTDDWLAHELKDRECINYGEARTSKRGKISLARTPVDAAQSLAEEEFNRYYIRALCVLAIEDGIDQVEVYRGRVPASPRPASQRLVGSIFRAAKLLDDLRSHSGVATALGIPAGPHSGLTVRLPAHNP
jgi:hypothetical protein